MQADISELYISYLYPLLPGLPEQGAAGGGGGGYTLVYSLDFDIQSGM